MVHWGNSNQFLKRFLYRFTFLDDIVGFPVKDIVELCSLDSCPRLDDGAAEVQVQQGARQVGHRVEVEDSVQVG